MENERKTILITGSSGFLGRYLVKYAPGNFDLIAHYRTKGPNGYQKSIQYLPLDFVSGDFSFIEQIEPAVIIHTAAMSSPDACEINPEEAYRINVEAVKRLVDIARRRRSRFIFLSTDLVFDGMGGHYLENDVPAPLNVYGETKAAAERYILENLENSVVIRPSLFYGKSLNGRPSFTEIMLDNLRAGKKVFLYTDQFRTPILVNSLASAIWELVEHTFTGILHLGGSQRVSRYEMGQIICEMLQIDPALLIPVRSADNKTIATRPLDCSLDISLAGQILATLLPDCATGFSMSFR